MPLLNDIKFLINEINFYYNYFKIKIIITKLYCLKFIFIIFYKKLLLKLFHVITFINYFFIIKFLFHLYLNYNLIIFIKIKEINLKIVNFLYKLVILKIKIFKYPYLY